MNGSGAPPGLRFLAAEEVEAFVREELFAPARVLPVVALPTRFRGPLPFPPAEAVRRLGTRAVLVALETGEATWALTAALPAGCDVYGGAARVWWPGIDPRDRAEDHPLLLARLPGQKPEILDLLEFVLEEGPRHPHGGRAEAEFRPAVLQAKVAGIQGRRIYLRVDVPEGPPLEGPLVYAGLPFHLIVGCLRVGQDLPVWRLEDDPATGLPRFSCQKLISRPWERFKNLVAVGEVVLGVVHVVEVPFCRVEVLPGVFGRVHVSEIAWEYVDNPANYLRVGQEVPVRVQRLDADARWLELSIKDAAATPPRERLELIPGGWPAPHRREEASAEGPDAGQASAELDYLREEVERLRERLAEADEERDRIARALSEERKRTSDLRKDLRSEQDRRANLERRGLDPLADAGSFLAAVRVAYAQAFGEEDRAAYPLLRMKVGPAFMASLRRLEGLGADKVVQVCAQVAANRAREVPGREVHPLHTGPGGSPQRIRARDKALAWRCALQDGTASARRLHWWQIPAEGGAIVEFAQVGVHDDEGIAE